MKKTISRRDFLRIAIGGSTLAAAGMVAQWLSGKARVFLVNGAAGDVKHFLPVVLRNGAVVPTQTATATKTTTPTVTSTTPPPNNRVVHVWDALATSWNFSSGLFRDSVNQTRVNTMTNQGLMTLTNTNTIAAAWQSILPGYSAGHGIAIKVNFNNSSDDCNSVDNEIDALAEPVNALISGMLLAGVQAADIWIYDATRPIPNHFRTQMVNQNVKVLDVGTCGLSAGFESTNSSAIVQFNHANLTYRQLTDVLVNCTYLINMPILKDHGIAAVSLGMKNHYGSIDCVLCRDGDYIHRMIDPEDNGAYSSSYSPILEINKNVNIRYKTVLVVGDGLFGALGNTKAVPSPWNSFGDDSPNSLFFSRDPVAVECVMFDILNAETSVWHPKRGANEDDHLVLAAAAGMGSYERADPWADTYSTIDYVRIVI